MGRGRVAARDQYGDITEQENIEIHSGKTKSMPSCWRETSSVTKANKREFS